MNQHAHTHLTSTQTESITRLSEQTGLSVEDVIKRAFQLYQIAVKEQKNGNEIGVVKDRRVKKILSGVSTNKIEVVDLKTTEGEDLLNALLEEDEMLDEELFRNLIKDDLPDPTGMPGNRLRNPYPSNLSNFFRAITFQKLKPYEGYDDGGYPLDE